jgi:hypothetical protein
MISKSWEDMKKKSLIEEKTQAHSLHRWCFLLPCGTLMFKNYFSRRRLPPELLLERIWSFRNWS